MRASANVGSVLVHIDLDGQRPHPSSLVALAAGRALASSWGATLYAALVVHDPTERRAPDSTAEVMSTARVPAIEAVQSALARAGADKVVVAMTDVAISPLWSSVGTAWQGVLDHLRPRVVLFGADGPSAAELGPRTGARLGAKLLMRARAIGIEDVELRDRDGGYVRSSDGGAAVALIGGAQPPVAADDDVDLVVLVLPGGGDVRIELAGTAPAEVAHTTGVVVALGDDAAADPAVAKDAARLAAKLGAPLVGSAQAARSGAIATGGVIERNAPFAAELCIAIGAANLDLSGATSVVRLSSTAVKHADGALTGSIAQNLADVLRTLEAM